MKKGVKNYRLGDAMNQCLYWNIEITDEDADSISIFPTFGAAKRELLNQIRRERDALNIRMAQIRAMLKRDIN